MELVGVNELVFMETGDMIMCLCGGAIFDGIMVSRVD